MSATPQVDQRPQVEALLGTIFKLMNYPARLDFQDMPDGALGVAVHFDGEQPGVTAGKRSLLVDSIQFLVNKAINRPNVPRRWVNLGVNAFPEPRVNGPAQVKEPQKPSAPRAPAVSPPTRHERNKALKSAAAPVVRAAPRANEERVMEVAPDPLWTAAAEALAQKAARLGRVYAVMMTSTDDRARLLAAAKGTAAQSTRAEGEGHWRRVTFMPDKLAPVQRKSVMPDYGDEDEDE